MKVSRSGYYKWLRRKNTLNRYQSDRMIITDFIQPKWNKHKTNGYANLAAQLRQEMGWYISDWLVHKVCKGLGIRSQARKQKYVNPGQEHIDFPNLIKGKWETTGPFQIIVTDTTILKNKYNKLELTMYIDVFNKEIICYSLSPSRNGNNYSGHMKALKLFLAEKIKRGYASEETILHSDQGSVYASKAFFNAHNNHNIKRSMSRVGTPTDNPIIEALNGWIKDDLYIDFDLFRSTDMHSTITKYINYYNSERLSYSLQYKTPTQYKCELGFI